MSQKALIIPIKVDAMLVSPDDEPLAEAKANFSRLPYNNGKEDINSENAYISENFLSQPFQNQNLKLGTGLHLHWALPDAFTKGTVHQEVRNAWLQQLKTKDALETNANAVVNDNFGNVFICGTIWDGLEGDKANEKSHGFIAKYNSSGQKAWVIQTSLSEKDPTDAIAMAANAITIDNQGNIFIAGQTNKKEKVKEANDNLDVFVAKYSSTGKLTWATEFGTSAHDIANAITIDHSGNIFVGGSTKGDLKKGVAKEDYDIFLAKFNPIGEKIWVKQLGTTSSDAANAISMDSEGNISITGLINDNDAFVAKYNSSGNLIWSKRLDTSARDVAHSIVNDNQGNVFVCGYSRGHNEDKNAKRGFDTFLAKYNPKGEQVFIKGLNISSDDEAYGITTDVSGNVLICGYLNTEREVGEHNAFLAKFNALGNLAWLKQLSITTFDIANAITADAQGNIWICGYTSDEKQKEKNKDSSLINAFLAKYIDIPIAHSPVPDRWVINRKKNDEIEKSWVVESNYLHPEGSENKYNAIAYPTGIKAVGQPFRYMGRSYCFYDNTNTKPQYPIVPKLPVGASYLPNLTAVGYGEHTFAAFYPNCHSVFGFHDPNTNKENLDKINYEILGWYSDPESDPINFIKPSIPINIFGGLNFDGKDDVVICKQIPETKLNDNLTIEAWIRPEKKFNICSIVTKKLAGSGRGGYALYINKWNTNSQLLVFEIGNKNNRSDSATTNKPLIMDVWQHVAVVVEGTIIRMYINGVLDSEKTLEFEYKDSDDDLRIGAYGNADSLPPHDSGYFFKGDIGEVRIWNIARTQDQIKSCINMNLSDLDKSLETLVAYYKCNEGTPGKDNTGKTTLKDASKYKNHGTLSGFILKGKTSNWVVEHNFLYTALKKDFNFRLDSHIKGLVSALKSFCYAKIEFNKTLKISSRSVDSITIGNTGTEALSAMLANSISKPDNIKKVEAKLETLQLRSKLAGKKLDLYEAFEEAYHEKGFSSVTGGHLWSIHLEGTSDEKKSNKGKKQGTEISLPESFAHWINDVNLLQQKHDKAQDELKSLQQLLYSDWCKYMISAYHADVESGLPQMDEVRLFIEENSIQEVHKKNSAIQIYRDKINNELIKINQLIKLFNKGLESHPKIITNTFFKSETAKNEKPDIKKDNVLEGVLVRNLDESENGETIKSPNGKPVSCAAVSFWVNINSHQPVNANTGTSYARQLLKIVSTHNSATVKAIIDDNNVDPYWQIICINGVSLDPYQSIKWKYFPKDQWIHVYLQGSTPIDLSTNNITLMNGLKASLAGARVFNSGLTAMEQFCDRNMLKLKKLTLKNDKGPRYWQPNEPVVLISGDVAKPTNRHGSDGELQCLLIETNIELSQNVDLSFSAISNLNEQFDSTHFRDFLDNIKSLADEVNTRDPGFASTCSQTQLHTKPWNPMIMEWKVGIIPLADNGGIKDYKIPSTYISNSYRFADDKPELVLNQDNFNDYDALKIFSGSTILTPHAKNRMQKVIEGYLENLHEEDPDWKSYSIGKDLTFNPFITSKVADPNKIKTIAKDESLDPSNTISIALVAYNSLGKDDHFLSQSFGGFNAALQMLHQTFQLPIADPLGFRYDQNFAERVKDAVQRESKLAQLPLFEFDPIRTGQIKLLELNIIDTFGQIRKVYDVGDQDNQPVYSRNLENGQLPPRIAQPARINFRWLSANNDDMEMNDHPACSPICGWLMPNNIDRSIMVYDQNGYALGLINQSASQSKPIWNSTPGTFYPIQIEQLPNRHLKQVVNNILATPQMEAFIELMEKTMDQIDPENFAQHTDLAMLMGRPIAVVRASVGLEVKGKFAVNQDWASFTSNMEAFLDPENKGAIKRTTNDWENVKFPIRIGEHGQLNDGVLGYWLDNSPEVFLSTVPENDPEVGSYLGIKTSSKGYSYGQHNITRALSDDPIKITMLMDPRGKAHGSCGILPAKIIDLPDDQFKPAIKNMSMTFFTRPLLTPLNKMAIPLPNEPGYSWSWLEKKDGQWVEISTIGVVHKNTFENTFKNGEDIWNVLLKKGWIEETENNNARVIPQNHRKDPAPGSVLISQLTKIQDILDAGHIVNESYEPDFNHTNQIKEGWLKLTPNP